MVEMQSISVLTLLQFPDNHKHSYFYNKTNKQTKTEADSCRSWHGPGGQLSFALQVAKPEAASCFLIFIFAPLSQVSIRVPDSELGAIRTGWPPFQSTHEGVSLSARGQRGLYPVVW